MICFIITCGMQERKPWQIFLPTVVVAVAVYANSFNIYTVTDCAADALGRTKYNTCFVPPKLVHKHTLIIEIHSSSDSSTLK